MYEKHEVQSKCPKGSFEYTIKSGDTLYKLASTYKTTVAAIMDLNPGINPNNLQVGQRICIPSEGSTTPPPKCPVGSFAYTIKPGDTLYKLAQTYNTTVAAIIALNPGINPDNLRVGQVICIPRETPPEPCPGGTIYVVRANDSLTTILLRFNISLMDLMVGNPDLCVDDIKVGDILCILPHEDRGCPCLAGSKPYTIVPADVTPPGPVVANLAMKFNVPASSIMIANPNLAPGDFVLGATVCIPMK